MAKFKPIGIPTTNGITLGVDIETTTLAISTTGPSGYIPISGFNANIPKKVSELENDAGYITINDIPSTDLSNYYNKTESDEKFALKDEVNSKLALSIVEDFPSSGINNTLYVNNEDHAKIYADNQWKNIALEVVENLDNPNQITIPTTEAVSSFVDIKISEIDIPSTDLSNYYNKTESDNKFATKDQIVKEVVYVDTFPSAGIKDTIYVTNDGETKIWNGSDFINMSYEAIDTIAENENNNTTIPTVKAVIDYVSAYTPTLPDNITTQGNEFNTGNQLVQLVNGKIPDTLYDKDIQHIFYVTEFPTSGVANSLYVKQDTKETKIYTGSEYVSISLEVINDLTTATSGTIATSKSIVDYLSAYYADKAYVTEAVTNAMLSGEVDLTPYAKTEWVNTELAKKANLTDIKDHIIKVDSLPEVSGALANSIYVLNDSSATFFDGTEFIPLSLETVTDFSTVNQITIPTTEAVSSFVNAKISEIDIPETDLSNYYNKTESDEKFALKDDVNSKLTLSVVEDFPSSGINNTLYVNNENHAQIYADNQWKDIALEVVENFETVNQTTVPTTQAVSAFIDEKISSIDIPSSVDLSNYYNKQESDEKFATKEQITEEVIYVDEFPSAGIKDTIYVNSNGQSKIWNGDSFISMSIEIAENINTPNQTTVPTTQAVKDYVDANAGSGGISSITVGSGLTGNGTSESPLSIDLSHFDTAYGIEIVADETLKLVSNHSIVIGDNNVGVTINAPVLTLNDHDLNTAGGLAQVEENTGKLPASIIPNVGSSAPTYTKVTINQSDFSNDDASYTLNGETGGKYYELNGICDVTVTNADGYVVGLDIRYMFDTSKTRLYIPNSLAEGTITNWTIVYLVKTIA